MEGERFPRVVTDIVAALMLLTRFPVRWERFSDSPPDHERSAWASPLVGVLVGACGAAVLGVASWSSVPPVAAALLAILAQCFATGGFHEDGLADVADGFGGGYDRAAKLEIMKDSRVGTYGALAVVFSVALRASALAALPIGGATMGLVAAGAVSRAAIVVLVRRLEPARPEGLGARSGRPSSSMLVAALFVALVATVLALGVGPSVVPLVTGAASVGLLIVVARRQIGGYTGDVLGAGQQVCDTAFLLALAAEFAA